MASMTAAPGCGAWRETWGGAALPSQQPSSSPAAGSRTGGAIRRCRHSCQGYDLHYLFSSPEKSLDAVYGFLFLSVDS